MPYVYQPPKTGERIDVNYFVVPFGYQYYNPNRKFYPSLPDGQPELSLTGISVQTVGLSNSWASIVMPPAPSIDQIEEYNMIYQLNSGDRFVDNFQTLNAPVLQSIVEKTGHFELSFSDNNNYGAQKNFYTIKDGDRYLGTAIETIASQGNNNKKIVIGGLIDGEHDISIAAQKITLGVDYKDAGYAQSLFSNSIAKVKEFNYSRLLRPDPNDAGSVPVGYDLPHILLEDDRKFNQPGRTVVKTLYVDGHLENRVAIVNQSKWKSSSYNGGTFYYTPIFVKANLVMGLYDATVKIRARSIPGELSEYNSKFMGMNDYIIEDIDINLRNAFGLLKRDSVSDVGVGNSYPGTIQDLYNANSITDFGEGLYANENIPFMENTMHAAITDQIKKQYYIKRQKIANSIRNQLKRFPGKLFYEQTIGNRVFDIITFAEPEIKNQNKTFTIPFVGKVLCNVSILAGSTINNTFRYELLDIKSLKTLESGKAAAIILLSDLSYTSQFINKITSLSSE
jgi:hypothetical protein